MAGLEDAREAHFQANHGGSGWSRWPNKSPDAEALRGDPGEPKEVLVSSAGVVHLEGGEGRLGPRLPLTGTPVLDAMVASLAAEVRAVDGRAVLKRPLFQNHKAHKLFFQWAPELVRSLMS